MGFIFKQACKKLVGIRFHGAINKFQKNNVQVALVMGI